MVAFSNRDTRPGYCNAKPSLHFLAGTIVAAVALEVAFNTAVHNRHASFIQFRHGTLFYFGTAARSRRALYTVAAGQVADLMQRAGGLGGLKMESSVLDRWDEVLPSPFGQVAREQAANLQKLTGHDAGHVMLDAVTQVWGFLERPDVWDAVSSVAKSLRANGSIGMPDAIQLVRPWAIGMPQLQMS